MAKEDMVIRCGKCGKHRNRLYTSDGQPLNIVYCGDCHAITIGKEMTICREGKCSQGESLVD